MDPNATYDLWKAAVESKDFDAAAKHHVDLWNWIYAGGFEPRWSVTERHDFLRYSALHGKFARVSIPTSDQFRHVQPGSGSLEKIGQALVNGRKWHLTAVNMRDGYRAKRYRVTEEGEVFYWGSLVAKLEVDTITICACGEFTKQTMAVINTALDAWHAMAPNVTRRAYVMGRNVTSRVTDPYWFVVVGDTARTWDGQSLTIDRVGNSTWSAQRETEMYDYQCAVQWWGQKLERKAKEATERREERKRLRQAEKAAKRESARRSKSAVIPQLDR